MDPGVAGALDGDADRVFDVAGGGLVVADEAGEDRQAGGVGRGPAVGAAGGGAQVPGGPRVGVPVRLRLGDVEGAVELVELAGGAVDDEHVAVAVAAVAALDRGAGRDRERPRVALVAVGGVVDRQHPLPRADDRVGEAVGARRAEVRVQAVAAVGVDVGDVGARAGIPRRLRDVLVPGRLGGERRRARRERGRRIGEDLAGPEVGIGPNRRGRAPETARKRNQTHNERSHARSFPDLTSLERGERWKRHQAGPRFLAFGSLCMAAP